TLRKLLRYGALALAALTASVPAKAQNASFEAYLASVASKARAEGVRQSSIDMVFRGLTPNQRVIDLDRDNISSGSTTTSTGFPSMASYLARHNTQARIDGGRQTLRRVSGLAAQVEREYGVPEEIVVAI